jgi:hypothetical protein
MIDYERRAFWFNEVGKINIQMIYNLPNHWMGIYPTRWLAYRIAIDQYRASMGWK